VVFQGGAVLSGSSGISLTLRVNNVAAASSKWYPSNDFILNQKSVVADQQTDLVTVTIGFDTVPSPQKGGYAELMTDLDIILSESQYNLNLCV
jgi:hypothetical protein